MHYINKIFLLVFITFFSNHLYSQEKLYFNHLTTKNGLSQNDVNCIYQDQQGFLWFGTHDGLNKYDGYEFKTYNLDPNNESSINSNLIFSITGDKNDNLWIGTSDKGINFFDKNLQKFTSYVHDEDDSSSLSDNQIKEVFIDSKNRLWIACGQKLDWVDLNDSGDQLTFNHIKFNDTYRNRVSKIFEDSNNNIWVSGDAGLFKLEESDNLYFKKINQENIWVRGIIEYKKQIIFASNLAVFKIDLNDKNQKIKKIFNIANRLNTFDTFLVHEDKIWVGTPNGLRIFNFTDTKFTLEQTVLYDASEKNGLSKNIIRSLYKDKTGLIWVGTNGGGVNKYDPNRKNFAHVKSNTKKGSLSYDKIRSIFEDSHGNLWIGTEGGSLNMLPSGYKDTESKFRQFDLYQNTFTITEIENKEKKILLIGGPRNKMFYQLNITNPNNIFEENVLGIKKSPGLTFSILEDSNKNVWIGTYNQGVTRLLYDKDSNSYISNEITADINKKSSISSNIVRNILEDKNGNIWFGTGDGLCILTKDQINKQEPEFIVFKSSFKDKNSISHNYILELFESSTGDIWVGTFGGGLNKAIIKDNDLKNITFKNYRKADGLANNVIKGILEDDSQNLWVSTNKGITKFNPKNQTFLNYDVNDGLQDNEFQELARFKKSNGEMLFGGVNGYNAFFPNNITNDTFEPETVITNLYITNNKVKVGEEINGRALLKKAIFNTEKLTLNHSENNISFEFASLHYVAPEKNNFAFKLEGFNDNWIYTTAKQRMVNYTNLPFGDYTLLVKSSNNDNIWDETPASLEIVIKPPFWLTKFALLIYAVLIFVMLYLYRRYTIISTSKKHTLELDHLEKEKNEELQRIKLEFFTNITHEFTTPLTLIKGPLNYLQKKGDSLNKTVIQEQYKLMQKNTDYLLRLISQLLDFRKINQGKMRLVMRNTKIYDFISEVSEPFQFLADKNNIKFSVSSSDKNKKSWFDHDTIEKVMNNLLSNAFKFTPDNGSISVEISYENETDLEFTPKKRIKNYVYIQVIDSGKGMDETKVSNVFERFFSEKNTEKKNSRGMGIGLAFVKDIVELHQGEIKVISKKNEGTNFVVRIPTDKKAYTNIPEITIKAESESDFYVRSSESDSMAISINDEIADEKLKKKSESELPVLLVVDDNPDIRSFIKLSLGDTYEIHTAENGQEGLELAQKLLPKAIVSDIMMPIMDGIEFCNQLKAQKETSHIPIILLTAKISKENEIEGLKTGADAYIRKPFDVEILELKLKNILSFREELRNRFKLEITLQPKEVTVTSTDEKFLQHAMEVVEKHMTNTDFNVEMLIKEMGYSRTNLYTKFKEITGLSSSEFIRSIRLKRAVQLFEQSDLSVKEIMYMTGFNTASYFAKCFKKQFGVIPSEYVKQRKSKE